MPRRPRPIRAWPWPEKPSPPSGQAATLEAALDRTLVCQLSAVPLLLPLLEQLDLRALVNRRVHPAGEQAGDLDRGQVIQVLVFNRLLAPQPLVHVETWLGETALPDLLGVTAEQCNDDRLGRALDGVYPHLDALWQDLIVAAVRAFDLDLSRLAYDITSVAFCGAYDEADLITYGYSRDHRPDRQQFELATTVTAAGGVPLDYRVLAGNVADRTTPVENLGRLQGLLATLPPRPTGSDRRSTLVISDRAMLTGEALAAYQDSGLDCLGPLDPSLGGGAVRALRDQVTVAELAAAPLAYRPQRAATDPDWEPYQGVPRELTLPPPEPGRPPLRLQALVVWSPGKARLDAQLRATQVARLEAALQDLAGKLGRRPYTTETAVERRLTKLLGRHPARRFLLTTVGSADQGPTLTWRWETAALTAAATGDGRYVLGTTADDLLPDQLLAWSKERDVPEKGYARLKGPLAIRPVYLHKQERILGLVFCTLVALLLFTLLELLARRAGLTVSAERLLAQFAPLAVLVLRCQDGTCLRQLTGLSPPLQAVLDALGWAETRRYLAAHL